MLIVTLALVGPSCRQPFAPAGAVRVEPPAVYATLWDSIARCVPTHGDFSRVVWLAVESGDGITFSSPTEPYAIGLWSSPHSIYLSRLVLDSLAQSRTYGSDVVGWQHRVVMHEMLHDLLQDGGHPPDFARCGVLHP